MKALLRKAKDRVSGRMASFVVMARELGARDAAADPNTPGVLEAGVGVPWDAALAFFDQHGFGGGWGERTRAAGHRCFVVTNPDDGRVVAGSWLAYRPEWVHEIGYLFDCGGDGCYVFGDFVEPASRGRWLQSKLARHRLGVAARDGRRWVYGLVWEGNLPSLKNCERAGLVRAGKVSGRYVGWWQRDQVERLADGVGVGRFVTRAGQELAGTAWRWRYDPARGAA